MSALDDITKYHLPKCKWFKMNSDDFKIQDIVACDCGVLEAHIELAALRAEVEEVKEINQELLISAEHSNQICGVIEKEHRKALAEVERLQGQLLLLGKQRDSLMNEVERLKAERTWQPIKSAPRNPYKTRILLLIQLVGGYRVTIGWRSNNNTQWVTEDGCYAHSQSFEKLLVGWMPLPYPLEEELPEFYEWDNPSVGDA